MSGTLDKALRGGAVTKFNSFKGAVNKCYNRVSNL